MNPISDTCLQPCSLETSESHGARDFTIVTMTSTFCNGWTQMTWTKYKEECDTELEWQRSITESSSTGFYSSSETSGNSRKDSVLLITDFVFLEHFTRVFKQVLVSGWDQCSWRAGRGPDTLLAFLQTKRDFWIRSTFVPKKWCQTRNAIWFSSHARILCRKISITFQNDELPPSVMWCSPENAFQTFRHTTEKTHSLCHYNFDVVCSRAEYFLQMHKKNAIRIRSCRGKHDILVWNSDDLSGSLHYDKGHDGDSPNIWVFKNCDHLHTADDNFLRNIIIVVAHRSHCFSGCAASTGTPPKKEHVN